MIFLQGSQVLFKVAFSLWGRHKPLILQRANLETIVDFTKNTLPNLGLVQMEKTISQVFEMDHVLQEEFTDSFPLSDNQRMDKLEKTNSSLCKQNLDLLEQLQVANARIQSLEATVENLLISESRLKQAVLTLEVERSARCCSQWRSCGGKVPSPALQSQTCSLREPILTDGCQEGPLSQT